MSAGSDPSQCAPWQWILGETLGTGYLTIAMVGAGIQVFDGDGAVGDLALLGISLATGLSLTVLISLYGRISDARLNSAVTLVVAMRRDISVAMACAYTAAQCAGGVLRVWSAQVRTPCST